MDRKEIKSEAKKLIKGNKWNILWPLLVIGFVTSALTNIIGPRYNIDYTSITSLEQLANIQMPTPTPTQAILTTIVGLISLTAGIAYVCYLLKLIRGEEPTFNDIIKCLKEKWLTMLLVELIGGIMIVFFTLLLIIPGIICALSLAMTSYIIVDSELSFEEVLKKSRSMMKGYKWDYFIFGLSFFGWILLVPFTLGLLLIWLVPYMIVARALYYEKLKEING